MCKRWKTYILTYYQLLTGNIGQERGIFCPGAYNMSNKGFLTVFIKIPIGLGSLMGVLSENIGQASMETFGNIGPYLPLICLCSCAHI